MTDEDIEALQLLAGFQFAEGQMADAIATLQQLIALQPDSPEYHNNLGLAQLQLGNLEAAIASFQSALQLNPYATECIDEILHQLTQEQQFDSVITLAIHALQVNPTWDQGFLYIGNALQQQGASAELTGACAKGLLPTALLERVYPNFTFTSLSTAVPNHAVTYIPIYESGTVDLMTLKPTGRIIHKIFVGRQIHTLPGLVVSVPGGRVWADAYTRAIFTSEDALVEDASTGNAVLVASSHKLPTSIQFQGTLASLTIRYGHNYFHWMYDLLPKLELLEKSGILAYTLDAILVNQCRYPFQRELLNLMGVPDEKIIDHPVFHAVADQLVVPVSSFHAGRFAKQSCDFLRQRLLPVNSAVHPLQPKRFYISRQGAAYRNVENEEEVVAYLQRFGFEKILLEQLTVQEQIALFANAEAIISPHGAGLANLVFCKPRTKVIEFFLPDEVLDYYWIISQYVSLNYYPLITNATESFNTYPGKNQRVARFVSMANMVIQLKELSEILKLSGIV